MAQGSYRCHYQYQLAINFQNFKIPEMSSVQYYRLALQQQVLYYQQLEQCLALQAEVEDLKARIAHKHKKHRRCDKEISKDFKCPFCERKYASDIALKLHFKLKHQKTAQERTWGCSTEEEHANLDRQSPELHTNHNVV